MCPFGFFEALMELPPLEQLVGSTRERDALVAYASLEYGQSPVLFLCALFDFKVGTPSLADARHIFDKYLADSAPHPIAVSSSVRKNIAKKLKSAKADVLVFQPAWDEVAVSITALLNQYEPHWRKQRAIDRARRELLGQIDFDLRAAPPLGTFLESPHHVDQLGIFAKSFYCEEIVLFWRDGMRFKEQPSLDAGRILNERYILDSGELSLNLEYETRKSVSDFFAAAQSDADVPGTVFDECLEAVKHQMQQNLYLQFVSHLRAIKADLEQQDEIIAIRALRRDSVDANADIPVYQPPQFASVIEDPIRMLELVSFAGQIYSQERLVFYVLVDDFRAQPTDDLRCRLASRIYREYVEHGAKRQVALEGRRYKRIKEGYEALASKHADRLPHGIDPTFFDSAQKEVKRSIEFEIFPRFCEQLEKHWRNEIEKLSPRGAASIGGGNKANNDSNSNNDQTAEASGLRKLFSKRKTASSNEYLI